MQKMENISTSSLVALKAELLSKKSEVEKAKQAGKLVIKRATGKQKSEKREKKNKDVEKRSQRDEEQQASEEPTVERAYSILEAKAKLYDKMANDRNLLDEDLESEDQTSYLVNFHQKVAEQINTKNDTSDNEDDYRAKTADEEWVEYTDALGRTRRCMRKDLEELQRQDQDLKPTTSNAEHKETVTLPDLLSDDMRREMQRKEWEQNELDNTKKKDLHYRDVLFEEARSHGVGFYAFSRDEDERARQMAELEQKRRETETARIRKVQETNKRQQELQERLKKVRQRKRLRKGLPLLEDEEPGPAPPPAEEITLPEEMLPEPSAELRRPEPTLHPMPSHRVRPWDQGKVGIPLVKKPALSQRSWVEKQREERVSEFAPPSTYSSSKRPRDKGFSKRSRSPEMDLSDDSIAAGLAYAKQQSGTAEKSINFEFFSENGEEDEAPPGDEGFTLEAPTWFARKRAEVPPPTSMDYYADTLDRNRRKNQHKLDLSESIRTGLASQKDMKK